MTNIDKLITLRERQIINDNVKPVLYFKLSRFFDLLFEIIKASCPVFTTDALGFFLRKIMPMFVQDNDFWVLGYRIRILSNC